MIYVFDPDCENAGFSAVLRVSLSAILNLELQRAPCQPVVTGAQGNLQTLNTVHPVNESPGFHYHVLSGEQR